MFLYDRKMFVLIVIVRKKNLKISGKKHQTCPLVGRNVILASLCPQVRVEEHSYV